MLDIGTKQMSKHRWPAGEARRGREKATAKMAERRCRWEQKV